MLILRGKFTSNADGGTEDDVRRPGSSSSSVKHMPWKKRAQQQSQYSLLIDCGIRQILFLLFADVSRKAHKLWKL